MSAERGSEIPQIPESESANNLRTIDDLDREGNIAGRVILVRADLDVPRDIGTDPSASTRLRNASDTIQDLLRRDAQKVIVFGHVDRPNRYDPEYSTAYLVQPFSEMLQAPISHISFDSTFDRNAILNSPGRIALLENTRFFEGEQSKDMQESWDFARRLACLGDTFVGESFAVSHRNDASVTKVPGFLPYGAGIHMAEEVRELSELLELPRKPFVAIVGGAKIETKRPVIDSLANVADFVLVGGKLASEIRERGEELGENVLVATLNAGGTDISANSMAKFADVITQASTVVWNGPMGWIERGHEAGTLVIASAIAENVNAKTVIGGGDTVGYLADPRRPFGKEQFSFVSSGGGAMLDFLSGRKLPGVTVLRKA